MKDHIHQDMASSIKLIEKRDFWNANNIHSIIREALMAYN
jgi:hypothetical protein